MKARKGKKAVCDLNAKFSQEGGYMETVGSLYLATIRVGRNH